jgi:hypothetical protein
LISELERLRPVETIFHSESTALEELLDKVSSIAQSYED